MSQVYFMIKLLKQSNFNNLIYRHDAAELSLSKPIHILMIRCFLNHCFLTAIIFVVYFVIEERAQYIFKY